MHLARSTAIVLLLSFGCGGSPPPSQPEPDPTDSTTAPGSPHEPIATGAGDTSTPAPSSTPSRADDPRISTSAGQAGGIVLLWPRIVGSGDSPPTAAVQSSLRAVVERAATNRPLDVRPEPERACPQAGCAGHAVGAVLMHSGTGCAVVATVATPGRMPTRILPWVGRVEIRQPEVPFRQPPEGAVRVHDFTPCADLATELESSAPELEAALRAALR